MNLKAVPAGRDLPEDFNAVIEIPMHSDPIKYEVDEATGAMFVDRFLSTSMNYPCNYGYIPQTLADDGDPVDVLVVTPFPLQTGVVIRCRAIGVLKLMDEDGFNGKVLAVPVTRVTPMYAKWQEPADANEIVLDQIAHFFAHYNDLEKDKWVKVEGWGDAALAKKFIMEGVAAYQKG